MSKEKKAYVTCSCGYETNYMEFKDLLYRLFIEGGWVTSDKAGGYYSLCPKCERYNLQIYFD